MPVVVNVAIAVHSILLLINGTICGLAATRALRPDIPKVFRWGSLTIAGYALTAVVGSSTLIETPITIRTIVLAIFTLPGIVYLVILLRDGPPKG